LSGHHIHPLGRGISPGWAEEWGQDQYGGWCSLCVGDVTQRLRWIPPGRFLMGSPHDEKGRVAFEGPQHEVRIEPGFWIFDTPCTQALWQAVMGENPSHFQGPDRPVELVSWEHCQAFLKRLNEQFASLGLALPSEAQWEYACRAGTEGPRYGEDLDAIAWYKKNSKDETHPVGGKAPNDWGLYDMLGNVWEWCADVWTDDYSQPARSGTTASKSVRRVVRGGSWDNDAPGVRAAFRGRSDPSLRNVFLGFRCAEFREGS
jgi:formylglycine-generating enzyme required for sulfatase activity